MVPAYFISTAEDHIAPWKTTYKGARYLGGEVRFVLGGSGHIAGIVNPPSAKKYQYWSNDAFPPTAEEWLATASQKPAHGGKTGSSGWKSRTAGKAACAHPGGWRAEGAGGCARQLRVAAPGKNAS